MDDALLWLAFVGIVLMTIPGSSTTCSCLRPRLESDEAA